MYVFHRERKSERIRSDPNDGQLGKLRMLVAGYHDELWPFSTAPNDFKLT
jgi:hypothetical protein